MRKEKNTTKQDDYKRILRIDRKAGLERKFEHVKEFNKSFFRDNYYNAFALTKNILDRNRDTKDRIESDRKEKKAWNSGQEKLYNIITFCGGRGSGKTSVMGSVIKVLQDSSKDYKEFIESYEEAESGKTERNDLSQLLEKYEFICMDMIDASLLEEKEDILDVILSKILQTLQEYPADYYKYHLWESGKEDFCSKEDIYRLLEEIDQSKRRFHQRMDKIYVTGESSVEKLGSLAGSMDIRKKLQELIGKYLEMERRGREKTPYLVISIDDLDLHGNAYEMLEQLHRYLMVPSVIIYLAISEREIQSVCKKHFEKIYESAEELSISYLEKVLPYSRRIHLPATFSGDFFNVLAESDPNKDTDLDPDLDGYPVKRFLLREIMRKTWVFYDGCGMETHFYEIENLRKLINVYYLFESMKEHIIEEFPVFPESRAKVLKECSETFVRNYEKLRNDVIGRMAAEKLNTLEQRQIFRQYYREDFSSNGEYLVREIARLTENEVRDYNYGELLGSLYVLGKKQMEFKPLIQCILALATIELTQNYMYTFFMDDSKSREKWNEYISGSVIGSWGNQILPKVKVKGMSFEIAYVKDRRVSISVLVNISDEILGDENNCNGLTEAPGEIPGKKARICKWLVEKERIVETVMLLCMFLTGKVSPFFKISDGSGGDVLIELSVPKCTFDCLGFVIHSMDYKTLTKTVTRILTDAIKQYCGCSGEAKNGLEKIDSLINDSQIIKDYEAWDKKYRGAVLPVYSLDIMYNLLKHVKKKMEKEFSGEVDKEDFLSVLQTFYKFTGDYLIEEDMFYGQREETEKEIIEEKQYTDFYGAFIGNPFVGCFVQEEKEKKREKEGKIWKSSGPTIERPQEEFPGLLTLFLDKMMGW